MLVACPFDAANFNPRSPWGERLTPVVGNPTGQLFQSTLPVGGATPFWHQLPPRPAISIHAPRGGSDGSKCVHDQDRVISIHAPRGGSDNLLHLHIILFLHFNPRSPWGERHCPGKHRIGGRNISIHAPRGGSDLQTLLCLWLHENFNPRSPWGERQHLLLLALPTMEFQSTLPVGGATTDVIGELWGKEISIHAPRGGSDLRNVMLSTTMSISIHAPRGGSDSQRLQL